MSVNAKRIVDKLLPKPEPARGPVNLYLDKALYKKFQESCEKEGISSSKATEELIREFIDSVENPQPEIPQDLLIALGKIAGDKDKLGAVRELLAGLESPPDTTIHKKKPRKQAS